MYMDSGLCGSWHAVESVSCAKLASTERVVDRTCCTKRCIVFVSLANSLDLSLIDRVDDRTR